MSSLDDAIQTLPLVGPAYAKRLEKLEIISIRNLLEHVPSRYLDFSNTTSISRARVGDLITVKGKIVSFKNQYTKYGRVMQIATVADATGKLDVIWFNQPFLANVLHEGSTISLGGKLAFFGRKVAMLAPEYEILTPGKKNLHTGRLVPVYPETAKISSKWLRSRILKALEENNKELREFLPTQVLKTYQRWQLG